jgi:hypothetical protein
MIECLSDTLDFHFFSSSSLLVTAQIISAHFLFFIGQWLHVDLIQKAFLAF